MVASPIAWTAPTGVRRRTPTTANIEHHARIVFEKALKRRMIHAAMGIVGACFSDSTDAFEELDKAERRIDQLMIEILRLLSYFQGDD